MVNEQHDLNEIAAEAREFQRRFKTCLISTASAQGQPDASYAPHVIEEGGHVLILISQLAHHTRNLLENPEAGLLFIADERDSRNLFARQRLQLNASARVVSPEAEDYGSALSALQARHGNMIGMLRTLPDFILFQLTPSHGRYVRGFGNAWEVTDALLTISSRSRG